MRTLLNVIWLVFSGFWLALGYALAGVVLCVLIITIPFGIASFRLAAFVLWPFGRAVVPKPGAGAPSAVGNIIWFLLAGLWMALAHLILGVVCASRSSGSRSGWATSSWRPWRSPRWARTSCPPTIHAPRPARLEHPAL